MDYIWKAGKASPIDSAKWKVLPIARLFQAFASKLAEWEIDCGKISQKTKSLIEKFSPFKKIFFVSWNHLKCLRESSAKNLQTLITMKCKNAFAFYVEAEKRFIGKLINFTSSSISLSHPIHVINGVYSGIKLFPRAKSTNKSQTVSLVRSSSHSGPHRR